MNKGWTAVALRAGTAAIALAAGFGAVVGVQMDTNGTRVLSGEAPELSPVPGDRAEGGGALPVVPVGGGACISGLNCGCIRYITCPGTIRHHRPAPVNDHPPDPPAAPAPGHG